MVPWFERHRPDVIIGFNNIVLLALTEARYEVPRDFGFIALVQHRPALPVTGLAADHNTAAEVVAEMLERKLRGGLFGAPPFACETTVPMRWMDGETAGTEPKAPPGIEIRRTVRAAREPQKCPRRRPRRIGPR